MPKGDVIPKRGILPKWVLCPDGDRAQKGYLAQKTYCYGANRLIFDVFLILNTLQTYCKLRTVDRRDIVSLMKLLPSFTEHK